MPGVTFGNSLCSGVCWPKVVHGKTALWASFGHPAPSSQVLAVGCHHGSVDWVLEGTSHGALTAELDSSPGCARPPNTPATALPAWPATLMASALPELNILWGREP